MISTDTNARDSDLVTTDFHYPTLMGKEWAASLFSSKALVALLSWVGPVLILSYPPTPPPPLPHPSTTPRLPSPWYKAEVGKSSRGKFSVFCYSTLSFLGALAAKNKLCWGFFSFSFFFQCFSCQCLWLQFWNTGDTRKVWEAYHCVILKFQPCCFLFSTFCYFTMF